MNTNNITIPKRFIAVTEYYGLVPEDTCFTLYRLVSVDPRKAPGYKGDMSDDVVRLEWRDQRKYFTLNPAGLRNALRKIAVLQASDEVADSAAQTDIGRFIRCIDEYVTRLERLIPEVSVNE